MSSQWCRWRSSYFKVSRRTGSLYSLFAGIRRGQTPRCNQQYLRDGRRPFTSVDEDCLCPLLSIWFPRSDLPVGVAKSAVPHPGRQYRIGHSHSHGVHAWSRNGRLSRWLALQTISVALFERPLDELREALG